MLLDEKAVLCVTCALEMQMSKIYMSKTCMFLRTQIAVCCKSCKLYFFRQQFLFKTLPPPWRE